MRRAVCGVAALAGECSTSSRGTSACEWMPQWFDSTSRSFATDKRRREKPAVYNADAWKSKVSPKVGRHGVALKEQDPQAFERMRTLLGYRPIIRPADTPKPLKHVTISNFQTIRYMGFPTEFKLDLLRYNIGSLNKEVLGALADTSAFLENQKSNTMDVVPQVKLNKE